MRGKAHSDETRAAVVAAIATGQSVRGISRELDVPLATVSRIKNEIAKPMLQKARAQADASAATASAATSKAKAATKEQFTAKKSRSSELHSKSNDDFNQAVQDGFDEAFESDDDDAGDVPTEDFVSDSAEVGTQKKGIDELVSDYLSELFITLRAQTRVVANPKYIFKQPAGELAVLHGVMADKAIRILEASAAAKPLEAPVRSEAPAAGA